MLAFLAADWKLSAIGVLLITLTAGGWYYERSISSLAHEVVLLDAELANSRTNEKILEGAITGFIDDLKTLEESNFDLEKNVSASADKIKDLEAREPDVVTVKIVPKECQNKLNWLKTEMIKLKGEIE